MHKIDNLSYKFLPILAIPILNWIASLIVRCGAVEFTLYNLFRAETQLNEKIIT